MSKTRSPSRSGKSVLGREAFAAIAAVEGLKLGSESRERLAKLRASGLERDARRSAVLQAYRSPRPTK